MTVHGLLGCVYVGSGVDGCWKTTGVERHCGTIVQVCPIARGGESWIRAA